MGFNSSKRKFIKNSLLGAGAVSCGFCNLNLLSNTTDVNYNLPPNPGIDIDKWTIEARYFVNTPKGIKCLICPNECKILPGEEGDCRTRINIDGTLYYIAYGNPCAVHIDPIEKKPLYHKIAMDSGLNYVYIGNVPGTDAENTYCPNCKKMIFERKGIHILQNNLQKNSCSFCNSTIAGKW